MNTQSQFDVVLDDASFGAIADLAYRESGLTLVKEKAMMIQSRLRHRLRALGLDTFAEYTEFVTSDVGSKERLQLISALTTNVSHFFREDHHFDTMMDIVRDHLPGLRAGGRMRIWSAGCSNGQEPLSIAMRLLDEVPEVARLDLRILATDIDPVVVEFARRAHYPQRMMTGLSPEFQKKYFDELVDNVSEPTSAARANIRSMISYNKLNLLGPWPMKHPINIVFCRNVVIYFDAETQLRLWEKFRRAMTADGTLFLGHSERIADPEQSGFSCTGSTTYQPSLR